MKSVLIAAVLVVVASSANAASCSTLKSQLQSLMAQANSVSGICQAAKIEVRLFQVAGDYNYYCVSGGKAQAQEYYSNRDQAQQTANASCN